MLLFFSIALIAICAATVSPLALTLVLHGKKPIKYRGPWSLIGAAEWTTYLQIRVVCAVTLLTEIEGERWSSEEKQ